MIMEVTIPLEPIPTFEPDGTLSALDAARRRELCAGNRWRIGFVWSLARGKAQAPAAFCDECHWSTNFVIRPTRALKLPRVMLIF